MYTINQLRGCIGVPAGSVVKNLPANAGDTGSIPGSGSSPGEGNGNPLQYSSWRIPWTEEPGGLQSMASPRVRQGYGPWGRKRVGHNQATNTVSQMVFLQLSLQKLTLSLFTPDGTTSTGNQYLKIFKIKKQLCRTQSTMFQNTCEQTPYFLNFHQTSIHSPSDFLAGKTRGWQFYSILQFLTVLFRARFLFLFQCLLALCRCVSFCRRAKWISSSCPCIPSLWGFPPV